MKTIGISWSDTERTPAAVKASGHTPGPWEAKQIHRNHGPWAVYGPKHKDGTHFAPLVQLGLMNRPVDEANARLIAKAPTMHKLLTIIATEVETECTCNASRDKCLHCRIVECLEGGSIKWK